MTKIIVSLLIVITSGTGLALVLLHALDLLVQ